MPGKRSGGAWCSRFVVAGAVLVLVGAMPVRAEALACGDVITQSNVTVTLSANLTCGPGDALVIDADHVVVDLKGKTIAGPRTGSLNTGAGVRVTPGHTGVEIRNGTIRGFSAGVVLDSGTGHAVRTLTLLQNVRGVDVANTNLSVIEKSRIAWSDLDAVRLGGASAGNQVVQNTLSDNVFGIHAADDTRANRIAQNVIATTRDWAIAVSSGARETLVTQNVVSGTALDGIIVVNGASDTVVSRNQTFANGRDGLSVGPDAVRTLVLQNEANGNADDGIQVDGPDTTVTRNTATGNGDLGIEAVSGVTDGGGNVASGNGNPAQCTGVLCSS